MIRTRFGIGLKAGLFGLAAMLCSVVVHAQSTTQGAIAGTVEDATEAVIPNATVTVHNNGTNAEQKYAVDASGYFKDPLLEPRPWPPRSDFHSGLKRKWTRVLWESEDCMRISPP